MSRNPRSHIMRAGNVPESAAAEPWRRRDAQRTIDALIRVRRSAALNRNSIERYGWPLTK